MRYCFISPHDKPRKLIVLLDIEAKSKRNQQSEII